MKLRKTLAGIAGSLIAFISLATIANAAAQLPPPVQTVLVTRGEAFADLDDMKSDTNLVRLAGVVADYVDGHHGPINIEDLEEYLDRRDWPVAGIEEDEYRYIYLVGLNGTLEEYCYFTGDLFVDDGQDEMLRVGLRLDQLIVP